MNTVPHSASADNLKIPTASGIYKITCIANKKIYIGSALNLYQRKANHFSELQRGVHHNRHLQRAWDKHGEQSFAFEVVELVLPMSLTAREQYWFNKLSPFGRRGYNLVPIAGSSLGVRHTTKSRENMRQAHLGKKPTPEAIEKQRQSMIGKKHSPERIEKTRQANLGKKRTPEQIEKMRGNTNKFGHEVSPATREKLRQANLGHEVSPEQREKLRQANLGNRHTPEAREKIRQAGLGRKHTLESIEKMRQTHLARWARKKDAE